MNVVTMSDSHSRHHSIYQLKKGEDISNIETLCHIAGVVNGSIGGVFLPAEIDILIHSGDMSMYGNEEEIESFLNWYSSINARYKILIAGNHDWLFDRQRGIARELIERYPDVIYLESSEIVIEGVKIYGEPRQPWFHSWAFNEERGERIKRYWDAVPDDVDILVTHGPPFGILDMTMSGENVGCRDLLYRLQELPKLKLVVFGHIHEHAGYEYINGVHYVNASVLNVRYQLQNRPQEFFIDKNKNIITKKAMEAEKNQAAEAAISTKPNITLEEFYKADIRICEILSVEKIEKRDKLYKLEINTGFDRRVVVTGIALQFTPEQLLGRKMPFILNLPPVKIGGVESHGMIIMSKDDNGKFFEIGDQHAEAGSKVTE